jgi:hypothetical protein
MCGDHCRHLVPGYYHPKGKGAARGSKVDELVIYVFSDLTRIFMLSDILNAKQWNISMPQFCPKSSGAAIDMFGGATCVW